MSAIHLLEYRAASATPEPAYRPHRQQVELYSTYYDKRYTELSTMLNDELEQPRFGIPVDEHELVGMWTANNDARGYAIVGDPAVRLHPMAST